MGQIINAERSKDFKCYATAELVETRTVLEVCYNVGSYGMGGYGFLGLKLSPYKRRKAEWLVCTLFGADNWFTVGGRWLDAHPEQYTEQSPLRGVRGSAYERKESGESIANEEGDFDGFQILVLGRELTSFRCETKSCELVIGSTSLEITEDEQLRPIFFGSGQPRRLAEDDDLRTAWILAKDSELFF